MPCCNRSDLMYIIGQALSLVLCVAGFGLMFLFLATQ